MFAIQVALTEVLHTSSNFHRPKLHSQKKTPSVKNPQAQLNRIIFIPHTTFHDYNTL